MDGISGFDTAITLSTFLSLDKTHDNQALLMPTKPSPIHVEKLKA